MHAQRSQSCLTRQNNTCVYQFCFHFDEVVALVTQKKTRFTLRVYIFKKITLRVYDFDWIPEAVSWRLNGGFVNTEILLVQATHHMFATCWPGSSVIPAPIRYCGWYNYPISYRNITDPANHQWEWVSERLHNVMCLFQSEIVLITYVANHRHASWYSITQSAYWSTTYQSYRVLFQSESRVHSTESVIQIIYMIIQFGNIKFTYSINFRNIKFTLFNHFWKYVNFHFSELQIYMFIQYSI